LTKEQKFPTFLQS